MSESKQKQKNLTGVMFKNAKKTEGDNRPHYNGSTCIDGVDYWVSSWVNKPSNGEAYLSLKYEKKVEKTPQGSVDDIENASI